MKSLKEKAHLIFIVLCCAIIQISLFVFFLITDDKLSITNFYQSGKTLGLFLGGISFGFLSVSLLMDLKKAKLNCGL